MPAPFLLWERENMKIEEIEAQMCHLQNGIEERHAKVAILAHEIDAMKKDLANLQHELAWKKMGRADSKTIRGGKGGIDARLMTLQAEIVALKEEIGEESGERRVELEKRLKHALTSYVAGKKFYEHLGGFSALRERKRKQG